MATSTRLRILIDGEAQFSRRVHGMLHAVDDWSPFLGWFRDEYIDLLKRRMDAEGAVDGESRWQDLAEGYAAWKQLKFPQATKILQLTGDLYRAVTEPEVELTSSMLTITIDNDYAIYHHSNEPRDGKLPRRQIADLTGPFKRRMMAAWRDTMTAP